MAHKSTFETKFRRRREGKTDYKARLELLKSKKPRMIVRGSNKNFLAQIVKYNPNGDETMASAFSKELQEFGWNASNSNLPAAYLTGFLCAKKAVEKGIEEAVLDAGMATSVKGNRCFSALKGAIDAGLKIPADEKAFPSIERISGKHIAEFAEKLRGNAGVQFSKCLKNNVQLEKIPEIFEKTKKTIEEKFKKQVK